MRGFQFFVFIISAILICSPVLSKDKSKSNQKAAKKAYAQGARLYEKEEYSEASKAFRKAYKLSPHWALMYNIGQAEDGARNYGIALESFENALAQAGENVGGERYEALISDIKRLREMVGYITVEAPDGAIVYVNEIVRGTVPLPGPINVSAAKSITVRVEHEGQTLLERSVRLSGRNTLNLNAFPEKPEAETVAETESLPEQPVEETTVVAKVDKPASKKMPFLKKVGWFSLGVSGVLAIGGGVTGGIALSMNKDLDKNCPGGVCTSQDDIKKNNTMDGLAITSTVLLITGAVGVAGSISLLIISGKKEKRKQSVALMPVVSPSYSGTVLRLKF